MASAARLNQLRNQTESNLRAAISASKETFQCGAGPSASKPKRGADPRSEVQKPLLVEGAPRSDALPSDKRLPRPASPAPPRSPSKRGASPKKGTSRPSPGLPVPVPQTIDAKVSESNSHESSSRSRAGPPSAGNSEPAAAPPSADRSSKLVERGKRREGGESAAAPSASEPPKPSVAIVIDEGEGGENTREGGAARAQAYVCCLVLGIMIGTEIGMSLNDSSAIKRCRSPRRTCCPVPCPALP